MLEMLINGYLQAFFFQSFIHNFFFSVCELHSFGAEFITFVSPSNLSDLAELCGRGEGTGGATVDTTVNDAFERKIQRLEKEKKDLQRKLSGKSLIIYTTGTGTQFVAYLSLSPTLKDNISLEKG